MEELHKVCVQGGDHVQAILHTLSGPLRCREQDPSRGRKTGPTKARPWGRKLVLAFFEQMDNGLVRRVHRGDLVLKHDLLTLAELLQTVREIALAPDPGRTAMEAEVLIEALYQHLDIQRYVCNLEHSIDDPHVYSLDNEVDAEEALFVELLDADRTKMALARFLQRHDALLDGEPLQRASSLSLENLQERARPFLQAVLPP